MIEMKELTPRRIVEKFDQYVYGQQDAKAILAVAIRNRWRLCCLDRDARLAVVKQNILLHGPTGSGKTALLRVLKNHFGLPVHEVDITEYTETGYVGKEVGQIIKDLFSLEIEVPAWYKKEWNERHARESTKKTEGAAKTIKKVVNDAHNAAVVEDGDRYGSEQMFIMVTYCLKMLYACARIVLFEDNIVSSAERKQLDEYIIRLFLDEAVYAEEWPKIFAARGKISRPGNHAVCNMQLGTLLKTGLTKGRRVYGAKDTYTMMPVFEVDSSLPSWDEAFAWIKMCLQDSDTPKERRDFIRRNVQGPCKAYMLQTGRQSVTHAFDAFGSSSIGDGLDRLLNQINGAPSAPCSEWKKRFIEDYGVVFVDEVDKLAESGGGDGKDRVSRTGVQRSLLKALEGEDGHAYNTLNILWIAAGSFANQPISKLMPELQGRLPLRARIEPLDKPAYVNILKLPSSVFYSSCALLRVDGVETLYDDATFETIADACEMVNKGTSDLGARRLGDLVNELFMPAFYEPDKFVASNYDIRGKKSKWLLDSARQVVEMYTKSSGTIGG